MKTHPLIEPENFDVCPVLLVNPELDMWTPVEISSLFFDRIAAKKELKLLNQAGHFAIESPGLQQLQRWAIEFIHKSI